MSKREGEANVTPAQDRKRSRSVSSGGVPLGDISELATPNRIAAIRSQAKAKGLSTPSPGRANAALTMLELISSQSSSSGTRNLKFDTPTLQSTCRQLINVFDETQEAVVDVEELVNKYSLDEELLLEVLTILSVFGVAVNDVVSGFYVWCGRRVAEASLPHVLMVACVSTSTSKAHLTRRIVETVIQLEAEFEQSSPNPTWTLKQVSERLKYVENDILLDLEAIAGVLCELELIEKVDSGDRYRWRTPNPTQHITAPRLPPMPSRQQGPVYSLTPNPRPTYASRLSTPLESSSNASKGRPTPQSADLYRSASRRPRISKKPDKHFTRKILDDSTPSGSSVVNRRISNISSRKTLTRAPSGLPGSASKHVSPSPMKRNLSAHLASPEPRISLGSPLGAAEESPMAQASEHQEARIPRIPSLAQCIGHELFSKKVIKLSDPVPTPEEMHKFQLQALEAYMTDYRRLYSQLGKDGQSTAPVQRSKLLGKSLSESLRTSSLSSLASLPQNQRQPRLERGVPVSRAFSQNSLQSSSTFVESLLDDVKVEGKSGSGLLNETFLARSFTNCSSLSSYNTQPQWQRQNISRSDTLDSLKFLTRHPSITEHNVQSLMNELEAIVDTASHGGKLPSKK